MVNGKPSWKSNIASLWSISQFWLFGALQGPPYIFSPLLATSPFQAIGPSTEFYTSLEVLNTGC